MICFAIRHLRIGYGALDSIASTRRSWPAGVTEMHKSDRPTTHPRRCQSLRLSAQIASFSMLTNTSSNLCKAGPSRREEADFEK